MTADNSSDFRITMMHHPGHFVPDLKEAEDFFDRVFGCPSQSIDVVLDNVPRVQEWFPRSYANYTVIRDVFFDSINPSLFVTKNDGVQRYETVTEPHLWDHGWSVEGMTGLFRRIRASGLHATSSMLELAEGDDPPTGPNDPAPFYLLPEEVGLRYRFYPAGPFPIDPRSQPGWELPPVSDDDPLGLDFCSHHTVLTNNASRPLGLFVDILGGEIIHEGRDELRGLTGTYVHIAGSTLEFSVPDEGSLAYRDWEAYGFQDLFHAITWKAVDLDRVANHLASQGVEIAMRSDDTLVTDPTTSIGIPWGFSTSLVPGDPR